MSIIGSNVLAGASGGAGAATGYQIQRSLRFNSGDSAYLNRTPSSAGNRKTWTWSGWVKRSGLTSAYQKLFGSGDGSYNWLEIGFDSSEKIYFYWQDASSGTNIQSSDAVFRDCSAWMHLVVAVDTTQSSASNRLKIYVNNSQITMSGTPPTENFETAVNNTFAHGIGSRVAESNLYFNGYLADVHFIDGQALAPTDFGEFDNNNVWQPKEFSGTYNTASTFPSYPRVTISPTTIGGGDVTHVNGGGTYFYSQASSGAGSIKVEFSSPITGVTSIKYNGGGYSVGSTYNIKINGTDVFTNLSTISGWSQASHTISSTDISSFEIYTANAGWSLYNLLFNDVSPSGTASLASTAGVNGFHLDFSDNSSNAALGYDAAGSNDWTVNNLSVASGAANDSLVDTPTNYGDDTGAGGEVRGNYCTQSPIDSNSGITLSNGNLDLNRASNSWVTSRGTIGITSGKYYWEATFSSGLYMHIGIQKSGSNLGSYVGDPATGWGYSYQGTVYNNQTETSYGNSFTTNDVIGVAFDSDTGSIYFYKNGVIQNSGTAAYTGLTDGPYIPAISLYGTIAANINFGQRAFAYAAPSGYKALCTQNLPEPTIADGSDYFDVKTWQGDGVNSARTISGYRFSPDFVWGKTRTSAYRHMLYDTVRGAGKDLRSDSTQSEGTDDQYGYLSAFTSDGFTASPGSSDNDHWNHASKTYVAWAWDAGANSSKTYAVTVVSDSGNKYRFDGFGTSAVTLDLEEGSTYTFDQSDSSNAGHPLRFSTTSDGTHGSGTEYTTGVTATGTPGSAGASTTIVVASGAPTLYYYCSVHSGMGGQANTNSTAGASNFDGSIQATVRANPSAGFSIVSYTGNNTNSTVGHGLNAAPSLVIVKNRDQSYQWTVYHDSLDADKCLFLNSTAGASAGSAAPQFNSSKTTSTTFPIGAGGNTNYPSGSDLIAYCFAPVEGYSSMGSYTGNGSDDGPFVYTGHSVAWVIIKASSSTSYGNWVIHDTERSNVNVSNKNLYANLSNAEDATYAIDFLSNGFKIRSSSYDAHNGNGKTYIYMAFAENPFRTARAR